MRTRRARILLMMAAALCFCLFYSLSAVCFAAKGDEVMAARKVISVVFDDSGSMDGDSFDYANYSMQALTALLNEQDSLFLTYMNDSMDAKGNYSYTTMDLRNPDQAVKRIRKRKNNGGGTPIESVVAAKKVLDKKKSSDLSDQFWLVILTDGATTGNLKALLQKYKAQKMSNGSELNIVYLAIGSGAISIPKDPGKHLYCFDAPTAPDITTTMAKLANLVSGRIQVKKVTYGADKKTVQFTSKIPIFSFSVFSQQSKATVTAAKTSEGDLNTLRNIGLESPTSSLFGNAAVVSQKNSDGTSAVIPAGTYTVVFSKNVDLKKLIIQYEPAIDLKAVITSGGKEIPDPNQITAGEKATISFIPVVPGTDDEIDKNLLPAGISWKTSYGRNAECGQ